MPFNSASTWHVTGRWSTHNSTATVSGNLLLLEFDFLPFSWHHSWPKPNVNFLLLASMLASQAVAEPLCFSMAVQQSAGWPDSHSISHASASDKWSEQKCDHHTSTKVINAPTPEMSGGWLLDSSIAVNAEPDAGFRDSGLLEAKHDD